jgi:hypothetical protein
VGIGGPRLLTVLLLLATPRAAAGQVTRDWQVHGMAALFAQRFVGGGVGYAVRPPGRVRFALVGSAGDLEGTAAGRAEAFVLFHLNPGRERGFSPYGGAGVAAMITGTATRGYLELILGMEQRPGRQSGLFVEAGVGGGLRIAAGYRFRSGSGIRRR